MGEIQHRLNKIDCIKFKETIKKIISNSNSNNPISSINNTNNANNNVFNRILNNNNNNINFNNTIFPLSKTSTINNYKDSWTIRNNVSSSINNLKESKVYSSVSFYHYFKDCQNQIEKYEVLRDLIHSNNKYYKKLNKEIFNSLENVFLFFSDRSKWQVLPKTLEKLFEVESVVVESNNDTQELLVSYFNLIIKY